MLFLDASLLICLHVPITHMCTFILAGTDHRFPTFCVPGTIGHQVLAGTKKIADPLNQGTFIDVKCQVARVSLTAHTDAKGIMQLIAQLQPQHVALVHGESVTMRYLSEQVTHEFGTPCHMPANEKMLQLNVKYAFDLVCDVRSFSLAPVDFQSHSIVVLGGRCCCVACGMGVNSVVLFE
jgi:hypothetical protein